MDNIISGVQAMLFVALIIAIWFLIPIMMMLIGSGALVTIIYLVIKDHKDSNP